MERRLRFRRQRRGVGDEQQRQHDEERIKIAVEERIKTLVDGGPAQRASEDRRNQAAEHEADKRRCGDRERRKHPGIFREPDVRHGPLIANSPAPKPASARRAASGMPSLGEIFPGAGDGDKHEGKEAYEIEERPVFYFVRFLSYMLIAV